MGGWHPGLRGGLRLRHDLGKVFLGAALHTDALFGEGDGALAG